MESRQFRVRLNCPGMTCPKVALYWIHHNCGGDTYINVAGDMKCGRCYETHFIQDWGFKCYHTLHGNEFQKFELADLCTALSYVTAIISSEGERLAILTAMSKNLYSRWK
jgi:hypothetical protein